METVDFKASRQRAQNLGVHNVPTFLFYSHGREVRRVSGYQSVSELKYLFRSPDSFF